MHKDFAKFTFTGFFTKRNVRTTFSLGFSQLWCPNAFSVLSHAALITISAFFLSHRFSCALTLTDMLHSFISEYQRTAGLCYLETNDFLKIISLLLNFLTMHLYPCSTMRQIWQRLPNLGCNNQTVTSWKRTTGIWKTPKKQLSDSTATFYSSKGVQPGKVSSLWPRHSPLAICPTLINLFVDQAKNYLARVWGTACTRDRSQTWFGWGHPFSEQK